MLGKINLKSLNFKSLGSAHHIPENKTPFEPTRLSSGCSGVHSTKRGEQAHCWCKFAGQTPLDAWGDNLHLRVFAEGCTHTNKKVSTKLVHHPNLPKGVANHSVLWRGLTLIV